MKLIYLKSALKYNSFDVTIGIKIFFDFFFLKETEVILEFRALVISSLCCCRRFFCFFWFCFKQLLFSVSFGSALSSHVFENPSHKILFEESAIISNDLDIKQVVREAIEIRLKINNNISLNRDLGEYSANALCTNLIRHDLMKYYKKPIDINTEPVTNRPMRSAAKKARLALKTCF